MQTLRPCRYFFDVYMREAPVVSRLSACYSWFMGSHVVRREMVVVVSSHRIPLLFISWHTPWSLRERDDYGGYRSDAGYKIHNASRAKRDCDPFFSTSFFTLFRFPLHCHINYIHVTKGTI